ncbi:hypothetical protein LEP1GSC123_1018 [Leptospira borgpetersenii str. 200701203]|uniref:Uncharacterized protein n=1 Tax=Leptospira borgpetersenii str. 200701203 TaxID=1193007 RepID=M3HSW7_LEPBO|nr:hypothetical protein LEP1GSC123_1018 [Leptospira borgpetersenii str. 200701203]
MSISKRQSLIPLFRKKLLTVPLLFFIFVFLLIVFCPRGG